MQSEQRRCGHDYYVKDMTSGIRQRCIYLVECSDCGKTVTGYADEIPSVSWFGGEASA